MKNEKLEQPETNNPIDKLVNEQWKSEEDYKKEIITLQIQNEKYRNELYQLGETVNKILEKTKIPKSNQAHTPNLEQQLELVRKQLNNVNQFIKIYQTQLTSLGNKKKREQMESMANTEEILKVKTQQLTILKRQVKQITLKNKGLEYKLLQYSRKNKAKSLDHQALQLKELINQNRNLKAKLQELESMQEKKQVWLQKNMESAKNLEIKIKQQQSKLPKINSRNSLREKNAAASLPKLKSQKKIYTKWLETSRGKSHSRIDKEIEDLQRINDTIQEKIKKTTEQIKQIEDSTQKIREKVQANQEDFVIQQLEDNHAKKKDYGCMVVKKNRKMRRQWVGRFQNYRFSDSRNIRQQTRLYKIIFNTSGYYQFFYYSVKDRKKTYVGKLPFDTSALIQHGKQSSFTVQYPDYIKNLKLKINLRTQKIIEMEISSNLGIQGEFLAEPPPQNPNSKPSTKPIASNDPVEIYYDMDIKANEAISCIFGSYGLKTDEKKNIASVWLEGLGVELIEDFVEETL